MCSGDETERERLRRMSDLSDCPSTEWEFPSPSQVIRSSNFKGLLAPNTSSIPISLEIDHGSVAPSNSMGFGNFNIQYQDSTSGSFGITPTTPGVAETSPKLPPPPFSAPMVADPLPAVPPPPSSVVSPCFGEKWENNCHDGNNNSLRRSQSNVSSSPGQQSTHMGSVTFETQTSRFTRSTSGSSMHQLLQQQHEFGGNPAPYTSISTYSSFPLNFAPEPLAVRTASAPIAAVHQHQPQQPQQHQPQQYQHSYGNQFSSPQRGAASFQLWGDAKPCASLPLGNRVGTIQKSLSTNSMPCFPMTSLSNHMQHSPSTPVCDRSTYESPYDSFSPYTRPCMESMTKSAAQYTTENQQQQHGGGSGGTGATGTTAAHTFVDNSYNNNAIRSDASLPQRLRLGSIASLDHDQIASSLTHHDQLADNDVSTHDRREVGVSLLEDGRRFDASCNTMHSASYNSNGVSTSTGDNHHSGHCDGGRYYGYHVSHDSTFHDNLPFHSTQQPYSMGTHPLSFDSQPAFGGEERRELSLADLVDGGRLMEIHRSVTNPCVATSTTRSSNSFPDGQMGEKGELASNIGHDTSMHTDHSSAASILANTQCASGVGGENGDDGGVSPITNEVMGASQKHDAGYKEVMGGTTQQVMEKKRSHLTWLTWAPKENEKCSNSSEAEEYPMESRERNEVMGARNGGRMRKIETSDESAAAAKGPHHPIIEPRNMMRNEKKTDMLQESQDGNVKHTERGLLPNEDGVTRAQQRTRGKGWDNVSSFKGAKSRNENARESKESLTKQHSVSSSTFPRAGLKEKNDFQAPSRSIVSHNNNNNNNNNASTTTLSRAGPNKQWKIIRKNNARAGMGNPVFGMDRRLGDSNIVFMDNDNNRLSSMGAQRGELAEAQRGGPGRGRDSRRGGGSGRGLGGAGAGAGGHKGTEQNVETIITSHQPNVGGRHTRQRRHFLPGVGVGVRTQTHDEGVSSFPTNHRGGSSPLGWKPTLKPMSQLLSSIK